MIIKYLSYVISPYGVALAMFIVSARNNDQVVLAWSIILFLACVAHGILRMEQEEEDEKDKAWREKDKKDKV